MIKAENIPLRNLTTFRMGGMASVVSLSTHEDVELFFRSQKECHLLGGGSNILVSDKPFTVPFVKYEASESLYTTHEYGTKVVVSAGKGWDAFVEESVEKGCGTLAPLSLIPGTVGAAPVQNIGAYGAELKDSLLSVEGYDFLEEKWKVFEKSGCDFAYRKSIFQSMKHFLITEVTFLLEEGVTTPPTYGALAALFADRKLSDISPHELRKEVIAIRDSKLPRVSDAPSVGSFFKNPIVSLEVKDALLAQNPKMPFFPADENVKLAAGWLIEQAKCDEIKMEPFLLYPKSKLIVTHRGGEGVTLEGVLRFADAIAEKVFEVFGVRLEREPEVIV